MTGTVGSDRGGKVRCMETLFSSQIKTFTVYNEEYLHFALFSARNA